jgi:peptidoglycan/LPS O-acetylase OafA/YrhL
MIYCKLSGIAFPFTTYLTTAKFFRHRGRGLEELNRLNTLTFRADSVQHDSVIDECNPPSRFYRPELDLLRFLAFLMVFLHHGARALPGWLHFSSACASGLPIFFFLSSYLITELLIREKEGTGTIHIPAFFLRRILRIWPLYFFAIAFCFVLTHTTHRFGTFELSAVGFYLLLAGNWWVSVHGWIPSMIGVLWSISIEEQYYVIWPFISRVGSKRGLWIASWIFLFLAYAALVYLGHFHVPRYSVWANSFVEFQFFALGAMTALLLHSRVFLVPSWLRVVLFVGGAASIAGACRLNIMTEIPASVSNLVLGYPLLAFGVILIFLSFYRMPVPPWCGPFLYLGRISYGLYVFHYLAIKLGEVGHGLERYLLVKGIWTTPAAYLRLAFSLCLCIGFAALSHRYLEKPFLSLKKRFTFIRTRTN